MDQGLRCLLRPVSLDIQSKYGIKVLFLVSLLSLIAWIVPVFYVIGKVLVVVIAWMNLEYVGTPMTTPLCS